MGAKRTPELIPLCHPIALSGVKVELTVADDAVEITATVRTTDRTGVEMEALTAVAVAGLTVIDMVKAVDKGAAVESVRVLSKTGGKSGDWTAPEGRHESPRGHRLQPRLGRRLRRPGRSAAGRGPAGDGLQCRRPPGGPGRRTGRGGAAGGRGGRLRRGADHRRHRHLAERPHPRDDRPGARPGDSRHPRGDPGVRTGHGAHRRALPGAGRPRRTYPGRQSAGIDRRRPGRPGRPGPAARPRRRPARRRGPPRPDTAASGSAH